MDEIDTLETEWLSYLLANSPWAYINKGWCRLEKEKRDVLDGNEWMYGRVGKRNCTRPYLPGEENRVHIETKGVVYEGAIFWAAISACWFRGIILKNSWCNSLPGTLRCSREQSFRILKLDVFQLLPTESFSRPALFFLADCLQMRLLLRSSPSNPLHSQGLMFAPLQAWVPQPTKGNNEVNLEKKKQKKSNALAFWSIMGVGIRTDTAREACLKTQIAQSFAGETASGQSGCEGKAAMKAGGWQSNNTPSLLLPCNEHCVHVGWHTSGMTSCIHAIAQPGGGKRAWYHPPVNCENKTLSWLCGEAPR